MISDRLYDYFGGAIAILSSTQMQWGKLIAEICPNTTPNKLDKMEKTT
ncbi:hypothetical protein GXM_02443 [Nostoc sphaeroides CCNUC1]|uniref:Uncharacterized protein n=1 Tax=Nostoc sphaeroides CCNUC1 TaxID=2653204 RepID=A0A5P8VX35_9NOSO|nr:hypothetical protein GXM_02443 [Nostoc sphaeroides CCNUC1]